MADILNDPYETPEERRRRQEQQQGFRVPAPDETADEQLIAEQEAWKRDHPVEMRTGTQPTQTGTVVSNQYDDTGTRKTVTRGSDGMLYGSTDKPPGGSVIAAGLKYKDTPYLMGGGRGKGVPSSIDCSAFVSRAYEDATGGKIKLTAFTDTMAKETQLIDAKDAQPGDLVFYKGSDPSQPGVEYPHVGIYAGPGQILDASSSSGKVSLRKLNPPGNYTLEYRRVAGASGFTLPTTADTSSSATADATQQYDATTGQRQMQTGPTPDEIAEQVRREQERQAMEEAARRRARYQDWMAQNVGNSYQSPNSDIDWFGRGGA
jgi:cell wall-associated NlpC family hydrolase